MMTEPITVCSEVDLAVGVAARIDVYADSRGKPRRYPGGSQAPVFSPTTDERHAFEAAEAVGLFDRNRRNATLGRAADNVQWEILYRWKGSLQSAKAKTLCLAICEAILAMAEKGDNDAQSN